MDSTINQSDLVLYERVSFGASGEVYRATWRSPDRGDLEVAAKKIPIRRDTALEDQLQFEIDILKNLNHRNVIKYYGQIVTPSHVTIVTEFASKGSLQDNLKGQERLPPVLLKKWAVEAARAIQYLRDVKVVHRDIKSPNFLITADNTLKICDFGIAKHLDTTKTTQNLDKGTLSWLAPEVFMDGKLSPKADIFAFGIVLWELCSCELPYKGMIQQHVMFKVSMEHFRPEIPADCPFELRQLMQECWDHDRRKRPGIDEVVARLERFGGSDVEELDAGGELAADVEPMRSTAGPAVANLERMVINALTPDELRHLYPELGLSHVVVEKAIANAHTPDATLQAREVLRVWHDKKKHEATPQAMITALQKCRFNDTAQRVRNALHGQGGGIKMEGPVPMDVATGFAVQNTEPPVAGAWNAPSLGVRNPAGGAASHQQVRGAAGTAQLHNVDEDAWRYLAGLNITTMQKRDLNRRILHAATETLCNYLLPDSLLPKLKSRGVLEDSEVADIRSRTHAEAMVDRLLEILKRKKDRAYGIFMELLKAKDADLYHEVKQIESRIVLEWKNTHTTGQQPAPVMQPREPQIPYQYRPYEPTAVISDRDFHQVITQLGTSDLQKLYLNLGLRRQAVEKAERRANTRDEELKAMEVFRLWRQMNGRKATREAILEGLRLCENKELYEGLKRYWNL